MTRYVLPLLIALFGCVDESADAAVRRANTILGLDVHGPGGIVIGQVKDLLVGDDGQVALIVFAPPETTPGEPALAVPWAFAEVGDKGVQVKGDKFIRLEFGGSAIAGWSLAAVTGAEAQLGDRLAWGRVADALVDSSGHVTHVLVDGRAGGSYAVPTTQLAVDREREEVTILADEQQVAGFEAER